MSGATEGSGRERCSSSCRRGAMILGVIGAALVGLLPPPCAAETPSALQGVRQIVTMGDSITQFGGRPGGYVWLMQRYLTVLYPDAGVEVVNAGISGHKSNDMLARFGKDVIDRKPDLVTISVGINDVWHSFDADHPAGGGPAGIALPEFRKNLVAMVDLAQAARIRVMLFTPTIFEDSPESPRNRLLSGYTAAIRDIARQRRLLLADQNAAFMARWQSPTERTAKLTADGVHMTPAGDELMARTALLALGIPAAELDLARPRVAAMEEAVRAAAVRAAAVTPATAPAPRTAIAPELSPPTSPTPDYILVAGQTPWRLLDVPAENWEVEHPEWLTPTVAPGRRGLTLAFGFPDRPAPRWNSYRAWTGAAVPAGGNPAGYDGISFEARPAVASVDWTVDVLLVEDDGAVYLHRAAATLDRDGWVRGYALFRDFKIGPGSIESSGLVSRLSTGSFYHNRGDFTADVQSSHLDPGRIAAIYFGTIHPEGGKNTVSLARIELVKIAAATAASPGSSSSTSAAGTGGASGAPSAAGTPSPGGAAATAPAVPDVGESDTQFPASGAVDVSVDPETGLVINGQDVVPTGIFGFDLSGVKSPDDPAQQSALTSTSDLRPGYVRLLHSVNGGTAANEEAANYSPGTPEEKLLTAVGATDWVLTESGPYAPRDNDAWAHGAAADAAQYVRKAPKTLPPPHVEIWSDPDEASSLASGPKTGMIEAMLADPFNLGPLLGPVGRDIYSSIYDAAQREIKSAVPAAAVGGFGMGLPGDQDWRRWQWWWQPLLEAHSSRFDFLTERHYGQSDGSYEANLMLLAAWTVAHQGRIVPIYNTGAGAPLTDRPDDPGLDTPDYHWWAADYEIRDILTMLREPDKVVARASRLFPTQPERPAAAADDSHRLAAYWAHYVLRDLRGTRLAATVANPEDVEVVAASQGSSITIVAYNHSDVTRDLHVTSSPPHGGKYTGLTERSISFNPNTKALSIEKGKDSPLNDQRFVAGGALAPHELLSYTLKLDRAPHIQRTLELGDAFADRWFLTLYPGRRETMRAYLPDLHTVSSASIRLAAQGVGYGNARLILNDHEIAVPFVTADEPQLLTLPVPTSWLRFGENQMTLVNNGVPGAGKYRFISACIRTVEEEKVIR